MIELRDRLLAEIDLKEMREQREAPIELIEEGLKIPQGKLKRENQVKQEKEL